MASPKYLTTAAQILHETRSFITTPLVAPTILGVGASYYNPHGKVQSVSRLLRTQQQVNINSIYGSFGFSGRSGLYGGYSGYHSYESGYRINRNTGEIKYITSDYIREIFANHLTSDEFNVFTESYGTSLVFAKKYDAAVYLLKVELSDNRRILEEFKKRKYQSQPYSRKNYKFNGYHNNKFEHIKDIQTKINAENKIKEIESNIKQIAIDHPEWLI